MGTSDVRGAILAAMATIIYYLGFIVFRVSATRMPVLRGTRPLQLVRYTYTNWLWLTGVLIVLSGVVIQAEALTMLPLSLAIPIFVASLAFILFYAGVFFRERLTAREWLSTGLFGLATTFIGISNGNRQIMTDYVAGPIPLAAVVIPGVVITVVVLVGGDVRAFGRHARPLAGVAYGFGTGVSLGISELAIKGVATIYSNDGFSAAAHSPYPYVAIGIAVFGLAQLQIGLQRCRISIVATVLTVAAKTELALFGPLLFHEPWPADRLMLVMRLGGFGLALLALIMFPRHETAQETSGAPLLHLQPGLTPRRERA
jgi:drug/metabolite transporter (DMT)-like permease